jgi:hypothetical protein
MTLDWIVIQFIFSIFLTPVLKKSKFRFKINFKTFNLLVIIFILIIL